MTEENRQHEQPDQDAEKIEQQVANGEESTEETGEEPKQVTSEQNSRLYSTGP